MADGPDEMRRQLTKTVLAVFLVAAAGGLVATATAADSTGTAETVETNSSVADNATVTIISYNDIQTSASDPTRMGHLAGLIEERRAAHDNPTVVIGGGDQVSPSSLSPVSNWTVPVAALNQIQPDADVIGNHDLDYGFGAVENFSAESEFPWLLANVVTEDGETVPGTRNYTVVERGGVRVGVVGLVDDAIKSKTAVDFAENGYRVADFSTVGDRIATQLKTEENVDVVVAAAHIGVPESQELARETENIDAIVTGDDEIRYPPNATDGVVITEAAGGGDFVGELNLSVSGGEVTMDSGRLIEVTEDSPTNEETFSLVNESRGRFLSTVAGETDVRMDSTFANYNVETRWGNLVTDAFRAETGAEVAITNSGGIRGNFKFGPGEVTYNDVYTSLPFGNTLVTKRLSGQELRQFLESQVTTLESEDGQRFGEQAALQVSGVTYEFVPHESADRLVQDVHVNGEPLDPEATYNVTVNSFMAGWTMFDYGWSMPDQPTVSEDFTLYGTAAVDYIEENSPVAPEVDGHIQRVDSTVDGDIAESGDTVTATVETPADFGGLNGTPTLTAPAADSTAAESASVEGETITVTFDADGVESVLSEAGTPNLELYAPYDSTEQDLVFFDHARLNADLRVQTVDAPLPGGSGPPSSMDGDNQLEDIDGDGDGGVEDVVLLLNARDSGIVQENPDRFDFDDDGDVDISDVTALYEEIAA